MGLNDFIKIGNKIKNLRLEKGISQKDMAEKLNIPRSTYSNYENDNREPNIETIEKIAMALDVSINELIGATDLTNEDKEMLDFLYDEGLVQLRDILKEFNYKLSDDKKGNIVIYKDGDIIAIIPEKEFIELGRKKLEYIKEFSEFQIGKLIDDYKFLY